MDTWLSKLLIVVGALLVLGGIFVLGVIASQMLSIGSWNQPSKTDSFHEISTKIRAIYTAISKMDDPLTDTVLLTPIRENTNSFLLKNVASVTKDEDSNQTKLQMYLTIRNTIVRIYQRHGYAEVDPKGDKTVTEDMRYLALILLDNDRETARDIAREVAQAIDALN